MKKVALYTLGCRVNQYETEAIAESFVRKDYEVVDFDDFADVYVINTCTVTSIGDKKSRQMIRKSKKLNPNAVIVAAGCYAQVAPDEVSAVEGVDIVVGTDDKSKIVDFVEEYNQNKKQIKHIDNIMSVREFEELEIDEYQDRTRAFLKIQDGCDRFCSYCMIPYARGPVRSRKPENIINEVKKITSNGFKEIILSGIHVASYGKDLKGLGLADIVEMISKVDEIKRIRIGSVDPMFFTKEMIYRLSRVEKLCPHFHLSLQSGCDDTLKRMNRHYTTEQYRASVEELRNTFKDVSITTDIIVGFPGETEEEFNKTYKFLEDIKLSKMHIFKYSPRKGTKAAAFSNQVSPEIKNIRSKKLINLDKKLEGMFISKFLGRTMDVLFEENENNIYSGYTRNYIRVKSESSNNITGEILDVKLEEYSNGLATGKLINN